MLEKFQRLFRNFALFAALGLFAACGGGGDDGGGGDGGGGDPEVVGDSISYTGSTDPADIVDANGARQLSVAVAATAAITAAIVVDLGILASVAETGQSGTNPGGCGGSVTWNFIVFDGTIDFNDYCEGVDKIILSGQLSVSGELPGQSRVIFTTTIDVDGLLVRDASGTVYRLQEYKMSVEAKWLRIGDEIAIDPNSPLWVKIWEEDGNKLYHPDHGYVLVSTQMIPTPAPLKYSLPTDEWPSKGVIEIIEDAAALPVGEDIGKAILTALLDSNQDPPRQYYQLQVDFDNDGFFDDTIDDGDWADL